MKGNFYLSHTEPLRIFTEKRDAVRKSNYVTPKLWGYLSTALISLWKKEGGTSFLI